MRLFALVGLAAAIGLSACASNRPPGTDAAGHQLGLHVAQAAEASGDFQLAESVYATASKEAPGDAAVQLGYADALMRLNKVAQARDVLESHLKTVPDPNLLRGGLGAINVLIGDPARAVPEFDAVLKSSPDEMRWIVDKAVALDMLGQHAEAQALYRRALAADGDDATTISDLALSLALSGHKDKAAEVLAPLADRTDVPDRVKANVAVIRAAAGSEGGSRDSAQLLRLADAISSIHASN